MLHVLPLLPLSLVTSTFLPSSSPALMVPAARRSATAAVRLDLGGDRRIFEEERIESIKAGVCSSTAGSVASAPVKMSGLLSSKGATMATALSQWQFSTGALAIELFLFGVVYRCTVRNDDNPMLKQGCIGAFALIRALSSMQVTKLWTPDMWLQLGIYFGESFIAFAFAAAALEFAWDKGWGHRLTYLPNWTINDSRRLGFFRGLDQIDRSNMRRGPGRGPGFEMNPRGSLDDPWSYYGASREPTDPRGYREGRRIYRAEDPVIR